MTNFIYDIIFLLFTIYIMLQTIGYGIYEIKEKGNKPGGIVVISFSILVVIFSKIMMYIN